MPLTTLACTRAAARAGERLELRDDGRGGTPGLALRCGVRAKTWVLFYRFNGKLRRASLGRYPEDLSLADARAEATRIKAMARKGVDPDQDPQTARKLARSETVGDVVALYLEKHVDRNRLRTAAELRRRFANQILPLLGADRPIRSLTKDDVIEMVDQIGERAPILANRALEQLKRCLDWATARGIIETNPAERLRPAFREQTRDRLLTDSELGAILRAARQLGWPWGPAVELLALTGSRRSEVLGARWDEIDTERAIWTLPASRVKAGKATVRPLSSAAMRLLDGLPRVASTGGWVFPDTSGAGPISSMSRVKARLDALSSVRNWRVHDLRRVCASTLAAQGAPLHVLALALGHAPTTALGSRVLSVYARHDFLAELRGAMERWGDHCGALAEGGRGANVLALQRA